MTSTGHPIYSQQLNQPGTVTPNTGGPRSAAGGFPRGGREGPCNFWPAVHVVCASRFFDCNLPNLSPDHAPANPDATLNECEIVTALLCQVRAVQTAWCGGGNAANTAAALARLGSHTRLLTKAM